VHWKQGTAKATKTKDAHKKLLTGSEREEVEGEGRRRSLIANNTTWNVPHEMSRQMNADLLIHHGIELVTPGLNGRKSLFLAVNSCPSKTIY
jgi:hypothetical protein